MTTRSPREPQGRTVQVSGGAVLWRRPKCRYQLSSWLRGGIGLCDQSSLSQGCSRHAVIVVILRLTKDTNPWAPSEWQRESCGGFFRCCEKSISKSCSSSIHFIHCRYCLSSLYLFWLCLQSAFGSRQEPQLMLREKRRPHHIFHLMSK